jgi:quercetin dioxygenase-like cupin family protein
MSTTETYRPEWLGGPPPQTHVQLDGSGEARWFAGMLAIIKSRADQTGGLLSTLEIIAPPGAAAPLHTHHAEDEGFLILEGEVTFQVGQETIEAKAGDWLFGPRDVPHAFTVGPDGARMFWTLTPGGFDRFVVDASEPAQALTPPPSFVPDEAYVARLAEIAARHSITLHV